MKKHIQPAAYTKRQSESRWDFNYHNTKINSDFLKVPFANISGIPETKLKYVSEQKIPDESKEQQEVGNKTVADRWVGSRVDNLGIYPELEKVAGVFKLKNTRANIHIQNPGQMHMLHLDTNYGQGKAYLHLTREEQKQKIVRIFVMLDDWHPGQIVTIGNVDWTRWKKGDVSYFSWFDIPHGTANFGHHPRPLLLVSGERTPEFNEILNNGSIKQLTI
jgi:hypothetical protein